MATPKKKPASAARKPAQKKPVRKVTVKEHTARGEKGSKAGFTARLREDKRKAAAATAPAKRTPNPNSFNEIIGALRALFGGKTINILEIPFHSRDIARVLGAQYVERIKKYVYVGDLVPADLHPYKSTDYSYNRWIEDQVNGRIKPAEKAAGAMFTPRAHQQEGIDLIKQRAEAGWRGFLLADTTGLGKTLTALMGASEAARARGFDHKKKAKLLVLCPNGAIAHWKNVIRHANINNLRVLVINYEQTKNLLTAPKSANNVKKQATKNAHTVEKGTPFIHWDVIIADEAHKIKNVTSQRSLMFEKIAAYALPAKNAPFTIWVTATAGQQPLELGYLAPLIGQAAKQPLTMETWPEWLKQNKFNVEKRGKTWQWVKLADANDKAGRAKQREDITRLSQILFSPQAPSIRRKPEDIAGWPTQNRISMPVQLTTDTQKQYDQLWTEFRREMKLGFKGANPKSVLAAQLRFAQKASLLRVPQTVENIIDQLESGYQVAVSVRFIESLEAIKTALAKHGIIASEFSGRSFINKEHERLLFQKGKNLVMLFTVEEAVSFHAKEQLPDGTTGSAHPRALLVHDLRYSAISMTQIAGRTHRDGQASNIYFMYSEGTVEEKIMFIMMTKLENMTTLTGDNEEDSIIELLEAVLV